MTTDTTTRLAALAFDPAAQEGEAIAAFKKLRGQGYSPLNVTASDDYVTTAGWNIKLRCNQFDTFLYELFTYQTTPYFVIKYPKGMRKKLLDPWEIELSVRFSTAEQLDAFTDHITYMFDELKKS